jgi:phosphatidylglycerol:prolipoprotein diacylglycerol transferase
MAYPDGTVPTDHTVHPTPVYETLAMGLGALILWNLRDRFRAGVLFAIYLLYAGTERFLVEFIRRNDHVFAGLTAAQLESLAMMVAGAVWIWLAARRGGLRPTPAAPPAEQPA